MISIGGISRRRKILNYVKTVVCSRCDGYERYEAFITYMYFSSFFIPLFKWDKKFYVRIFCYDVVYELDRKVGKVLLRDRQVDTTQLDLTPVQGGNGRSTCEDGVYKVWKKCIRYGYETGEDSEYCSKCGGKPQGRQMVHTPKGQVTCSHSH